MTFFNHKDFVSQLERRGDYTKTGNAQYFIVSRNKLPTEYQSIIENALNKLADELINAASKNYLIEELSFYFKSIGLDGVIPILSESKKDSVEYLYNDLKQSNLLRK